jgi:hypothetical protein
MSFILTLGAASISEMSVNWYKNTLRYIPQIPQNRTITVSSYQMQKSLEILEYKLCTNCLEHGPDGPGFEFRQGKEVLLFWNMYRSAMGSTQPLSQQEPRFFAGDKNLATHVHLVARLRMSGAVPLLLMCVCVYIYIFMFMAWTVTTLPLPFYVT